MALSLFLRRSSTAGFLLRSTRHSFSSASTNQSQLSSISLSYDNFQYGQRSPEESSAITAILQCPPMTRNTSTNARYLRLGTSFVRYGFTMYRYTEKPLDSENHQIYLEDRIRRFVYHRKNFPNLPKYDVPSELKERFESLAIPHHSWNLAMLEDIDEMSDFELQQLAQWRSHHYMDNYILVGSYLFERGIRSAALIASWLGCRMLPVIVEQTVHRLTGEVDAKKANRIRFGEYKKPDLKPLTDDQDWESTLDTLLLGQNELEEQIGYRFKNRLFLLQAVSDKSYKYNELTHSNIELTILGDAVLNMILGVLPCLDTNSTKNSTLSNMCISNAVVRSGLHRYYRHMDSTLNSKIKKYYELRKSKMFLVDPGEYLTDLEKGDARNPNKLLSKYMKAILGAVFVDSESFEDTWNVVQHIMAPEINMFKEECRVSPIERLKELRMEYTIGKADSAFVVEIDIKDIGKFEGYGRTKKVAKFAAISKALENITSN